MKTFMLGVLALNMATVVHGGNICCVPTQWDALEYREGGDRPTNGEFGKFSYDATNERLAASGTRIEGGERTNFRLILDFTNRRHYDINLDTETCENKTLNRPFKELCIPDTATLEATSYLGSGNDTLDVKVYRTSVNETDVKLQILRVITKDDCVPVSEDAWGKRFENDKYFASVNFANITRGISDTTVFTPPSYCSPAGQNFWDSMVNGRHDILKL